MLRSHVSSIAFNLQVNILIIACLLAMPCAIRTADKALLSSEFSTSSNICEESLWQQQLELTKLLQETLLNAESNHTASQHLANLSDNALGLFVSCLGDLNLSSNDSIYTILKTHLPDERKQNLWKNLAYANQFSCLDTLSKAGIHPSSYLEMSALAARNHPGIALKFAQSCTDEEQEILTESSCLTCFRICNPISPTDASIIEHGCLCFVCSPEHEDMITELEQSRSRVEKFVGCCIPCPDENISVCSLQISPLLNFFSCKHFSSLLNLCSFSGFTALAMSAYPRDWIG